MVESISNLLNAHPELNEFDVHEYEISDTIKRFDLGIDLDLIEHFNSDSKFDVSYLKMAKEWSLNSKAVRKKVGALLVKNNCIISDGYNGTPSGWDNLCEDEDNNTHWYVLHAESNAITKVAKSYNSSDNSILYVTISPCKECSKLIIQSGIKRVVFNEFYRDTAGVLFLLKNHIKISYYTI